MPLVERRGQPALYYEVDDYTDPWRNAPTIVLQHGFARSSKFWYQWVPYLSRFYKVIRSDLRGLGRSSKDFAVTTGFSAALWIADLEAILDHAGVDSVHYCGESTGGIIGMLFAAERPQRVRTLSLISAPVRLNETAAARVGVGEAALRQLGPMAYARAKNGVDRFPPAINVTLYPQLPYDVLRDFAPVSLVATTPLILAVHPSQPVTTVAELIALAKARPGELFFPSAGTGDAPHLAAELFNMTAGVKLMHVPYKGAAIGINDLVAGRLALMFGTSPATLQHVRSGRLRAIAVTSRTRTAVMPELPTVTESGLAGYEAGSWYGMLAPARTPKAVVARLAAAVSAAIASNDLSEKLKAQGVDVIGNTPAQFNAYIRQEIVKWAKVIQAAGINAGAAH